MKTYRVSVLMFVLSFGLIEYCTGGIVVFTDRPTWLAAAGVITGSEDFNSFTVDTSYGASSPLALSSGITLSGVGEATFQIVDAAPFLGHPVNGEVGTWLAPSGSQICSPFACPYSRLQ